MNSTFRARWLASSEVISQVRTIHLRAAEENKMAFVGTLWQIKLLFGPLVIQLVWYIPKQLFTEVKVKVVDIYLAALRLSKYPPLFTSTSVNNCEIWGRQWLPHTWKPHVITVVHQSNLPVLNSMINSCKQYWIRKCLCDNLYSYLIFVLYFIVSWSKGWRCVITRKWIKIWLMAKKQMTVAAIISYFWSIPLT